jgi:acyl-CoA dehydrogenase
MDNIYLTPEHETLREQVARFLAREVEPHAQAWEEQGFTPREVLRKMGDAGLLGPDVPERVRRGRGRRADQPGVR